MVFCKSRILFLLKIIKYGLSLYKSKNLCLSGGCALNSSANGKIKENLDIEKVFIPYAPGDGGGSIGSALVISIGNPTIVPNSSTLISS